MNNHDRRMLKRSEIVLIAAAIVAVLIIIWLAWRG
jgi:CHASE3 domain sensor protein